MDVSMDPLDVVVPEEELQKFEKKYNDARSSGQLTDNIQFDYAWCLVKTRNAVDIKKGITILNELCRRNVQDRRDYIFYLAVGYTHLHDYNKALELLDQILRQEPTNRQVLQLRERIAKKKRDEHIEDAAVAGGAIAILGGLALAAYGIGKKLSN